MTKFKLYYDKDKEIEWLNEMAAEGYAMTSFFAGFYTFEPCEKGEWQYQVDIGNGFFSVNKEYAAFMEEMGIEIVTCWGPWVILRRKAQEGEFALYSDVDSRIAQYKKILLMFKIVTAIELLGLIYEIYAGVKGTNAAWPFVLIIGAFVCVFFNMIARTKDTIAMLQEQKGETPDGVSNKKISMILPTGLLINSVNLLAGDRLPVPIRYLLLGCAVGMIIYGSVLTLRQQNKMQG
ncbi:MAG: DUF2812 domain-containing protein [Lachnospiraceae bacterium]|nr:DUF2812 domain-containing protein [Lachnospiraceae bacterium]